MDILGLSMNDGADLRGIPLGKAVVSISAQTQGQGHGYDVRADRRRGARGSRRSVGVGSVPLNPPIAMIAWPDAS